MNENLLYATGQALCRIGGTLLFDLKIKGMRNVPRTGGVLIIANHQSYIDPLLIGSQLPRATSFLGKSELFANRVTQWLSGLKKNR